MKKVGIILIILVVILAAIYFIFKPFGYSKKELAEKYINKSYNITKEEAVKYNLAKIDEQFYDKPEVKELFTEKGLEKAKDDSLIVQAISVAEVRNVDVKVKSIETKENSDGTIDVNFEVEWGNQSMSDGFTISYAKDGLKTKIDGISHKK